MNFKAKWLLFDFGGCLDSDGLHSRSLFLNEFLHFGLFKKNENVSLFQDAYTYSDRMVIDQSLLVNSSLLEMNQTMCELIAHFLKIKDLNQAYLVAQSITHFQEQYLRRNKGVLDALALKYKLGVISNFSGNLKKILDGYSLAENFKFVLDSYHVGCSKPDPEIFLRGIALSESAPEDICFIGDNPERDIAPAKKLGMKTILISSELKDSLADFTIISLMDLLPLLSYR